MLIIQIITKINIINFKKIKKEKIVFNLKNKLINKRL